MNPAFLSFKMHPTLGINSTPVLIFGAEVTSLIDSVILSSQVETPLIASLWIAREVETGFETDFMLARHVPLVPFETLNFLMNTALTLERGDLLYAMSDYSDNLFNTFVSYRALKELGVVYQ